jgi:hypothetical protein
MMNRPPVDPIGVAFVLALAITIAWLLRTFLHVPIGVAVVLGLIAPFMIIPTFIVAGLMLWERWHHGRDDKE